MVEDPLPDENDRRALPDLLSRLGPVDVVLVEGFKNGDHPKLEVYRAEAGKQRLYGTVPNIVALATPASQIAQAEADGLPVFDLDTVEPWLDQLLALFS